MLFSPALACIYSRCPSTIPIRWLLKKAQPLRNFLATKRTANRSDAETSMINQLPDYGEHEGVDLKRSVSSN